MSSRRTAQELADRIKRRADDYAEKYKGAGGFDGRVKNSERLTPAYEAMTALHHDIDQLQAIASQAEPVVFGWAIVDKDGREHHTRACVVDLFGYEFKPSPLSQEDCTRADRERPGCAPHRLVTLYTTPPAPAPILSADHTGMRVDYSGLLGQCRRALARSEPGEAEMLRQLQEHLKELGRRYYAGDLPVVDEFLQLYCIEHDARVALKENVNG